MLKKRLIPIVLLKNGWVVQSKLFKEYQNLGNPLQTVKRLSEWCSDELIYLDISKDNNYDIKRNDQNYPNRKNFIEIISDVSKVSFMPLTVGGKIKNLNDIELRLKEGADKVSINTYAFRDKKFIKYAAKEFGSQCIVISIDVKKINNNYKVFVNGAGAWTRFIAMMLSLRRSLPPKSDPRCVAPWARNANSRAFPCPGLCWLRRDNEPAQFFRDWGSARRPALLLRS